MPNWNHIVLEHLAVLRLPPEREIEIAEELALHMEAAYESALADGLSEEEAEASAVQGYDWRLLECELSRAEQPLATRALQPSLELIERKGGMRMESFIQDLRYGARMLMRRPGFTLIAVLTLALGVGANAAIFSLVNGILLRPLPFKAPEQLVFISQTSQRLPQMYVTMPNFADLRDQNQAFERIAAVREQNFNLTGIGDPERLNGTESTHEFFSVIGEQPLLGRLFTAEEDKPGATPVALLSHRFWRRRFGADPNAIGQKLNLNNTIYTVIGVMPDSAYFRTTEVWASLGRRLGDQAWMNDRGAGAGTFVWARRKPGVTLPQAQAELDAIAKRIEQQDANAKGLALRVADLTELSVRDIRPSLVVLLGAVAFVLAVACANVANLLLARASTRRREIAVRMALGAGRARITRQLLTESALLAVCGGLLGLLLGYWGMNALVAIAPEGTPRINEVRMDQWVLAFTTGISLLTGFIFGLAPAIQGARADLNDTLKEGGRSAAGMRSRLRSALVVVEIALSLILLIGAGLLIKSFLRLLNTDLGFNPEKVLSVQLSLPEQAYAEPQKRIAFFQQITERMKALPGVEVAATATGLPLSGNFATTTFGIQGQPDPGPGKRPVTDVAWISPDYFRALQVGLLRGRFFTDGDAAGTQPVIIVNETLARNFWPDQDPLGKQILLRIPRLNAPFTIVGVVKPVKRYGVDLPFVLQAYVPYAQDPGGARLSLALRTTTDPALLAAAVRAQVREMDSRLPTYGIRPIEEFVRDRVAQRRLQMILLGVFAVVAIALAAVGIYGVLSYAVTQRAHEIGVRMALGAQGRDVLKLVMRQGLALLFIGIAIGLTGAFALTRVLKTLLFEVSATDPAIFTSITLLLATVALLACWVPARRATKVDPLTALRHE